MLRKLLHTTLIISVLLCFSIRASAQCAGTSGFTMSSPNCINQSITFTDTTVATRDSMLWIFKNDNTTYTSTTVNKTYTTAQTDTVWMIRFFSNPSVCSDTVFRVITINQTIATFNPTGTLNICTGDSTTLSVNTGTGRTYQWKLNGANIGGATSATYRTPTAGNYTVEVTQNGCSIVSDTVIVVVYNYPNADFTFTPDSACSGTSVGFTNTSTGSSLSYAWSFGNGATSTATNPTTVYDTIGTRAVVGYTARLIASTPGNCRDTVTKTIRVRRKPSALIDDFNNLPKFIQCNVSSSVFSLQIDNTSTTKTTNASYSINWGDGSSVQNFGPTFDTITHVYTAKGAFPITVTVTDSFGCVNSQIFNAFNGGNPAVSIGNAGGTSGCTPYAVNFTIDTSKATGIGNNAAGTTYTLTFNDGTTPVNFTHPPPSSYTKSFTTPSCGVATTGFPNSFQAEMVVTNPCGTNSATVKPIYISTKPEARIEIDPFGDTVCRNRPITIYDDSDTGSVSSNSGCNETPRRLWDISPGSGWTLNSGYFGNPSNWNNNPANWGSQSLGIEFNDTGTYTVRLVVGNIAQAGLSVCGDDTITRIIRVFQEPVPNFTLNVNPTNGCINNTITVTDSSRGQNLSYQWVVIPNSGYTISSGSLTSPAPTFVFNTPGTYILRQVVSNICESDSLQDTITVKGPPVATLPSARQYCGPQTLSFDTLVSNTNHRPVYNSNLGTTLSYSWTVTGGTYTYTSGDSTQANPSINFSTPGTYTVTVTFTNECGQDTARQIITIHPLPDASYTVNDTDQCINGNSFSFTNTSTVSSGSITGNLWTFGDASGVSTVSPTKSYSSTGTFNVRLIVTSNNGCVDTITKQVIVRPKPTPNFTINDTDQCINGNSFVFTNTSTISSGTNTYKWTFTNRAGDTSIVTSPTKVYDTVGNFSVKLLVTSNNGCTDSITKTIRVYPKPEPAFTVNDTDQCINGNSFVFTNGTTISSGTLAYKWSFSTTNSDTSASTNPTKVYTSANTYTVKLVARSALGCRDSISRPVYVYPKPTPAYTINDTDQCLSGNNFVFTNGSTISSGTNTYLWKFSTTTSDTSIVTSPSKTYSAAGTYTVKLIATSDMGCKDSLSKSVVVYAQPVADFNINDTDQCINGNSFAFTDASTAGGAYTRVWSFGDGTTSTSTNPSKTYSTPGTYTVKLVVTITGAGCKDSITKTVYVRPKPTPSFTSSSALLCFPGHSFSLTNTSTISSGSNIYLWKFSAPSSTDTSTQTSPTKSYSAAGTYTIRLIVTSDFGCKDSTSTSVTVRPTIINNNISASQGICAGFAPDTLKQSGTSISGGTGTFNYQWQESSDSVSWATIGGATSAFYKPGTLTATTYYRRIAISSPCSDTSAPVKITVTPAISSNTITANQVLCAGFAPAKFIGSTPTAGVGTFTYQWQQSADSVSWSNIGGATDTSYQAGVLNTTTFYRRIVSSGVCNDISSGLKVRVNPKPSAAFTTASVCFGFNASFASTSTLSSGTIAQYNWSFGDASTGTGSSTTHSYATPAAYTIKLIITSDSSCKDSTTRTIRVHPKPTAAYTHNDTCQTFAHSFNASTSSVSSGSITSYGWNFGDATTGSGSSISKTYATSGSFNTKLIVTTDSSCTDSISKTITVHPKPSPAYTTNDTDQCVNGNNFVFTNASTIASGTQTYLWRRGESAADTVITTNATKTYAANGNYNVRLIATSNFGCKDSITKTMVVYAKPTPVYAINDTDQCLNGNSFIFTNSSTVNPVVGLSYLWRFGNGDTSTQTSPTKSYSTEGTYTVKLVVTSVNSCTDSISKTVYVYPKPVPAFTINDTLQCFGGNLFIYTNGSSISSGTNSYFWKLNLVAATDTSTQTNVTKSYATSGNLTVRLTATSDKLCKDSIQKNIVVRPDIVNNAIAPAQNTCSGSLPDTLKHTGGLLNGGDGTFTYQWQQSTDSVSWSNVGGATAAQYSPPALTVTTWYRRIVFSGPCSDTSSPIKINVTAAVNNNTVTASQTLCAGFAPAKFAGSLPTGGNGIFTYQWQFSVDSASWSDITAATDTHYQAVALSVTTWYRRKVTSGLCTVISLPVKITVDPKPAASFTTANVCFGFNAAYTSTSTVSAGSITSWSWNFGDASTATGSTTSHGYAAAGSYTTKLIVTTAAGCKDSTTTVVQVFPKPVAAYVFNDTCLTKLTSFNGAGSTVAAGAITAYNWNFGDATTASGTAVSKTYGTTGTYSAKLIVTTNNSCKDSISKNVNVYHNPVTAYTVNDTDQCVNGNSFTFTNGSSIGVGSLTYLWRRGENAADTVITTNATKTYAANGNYNVRLVATSNMGCKDSITKTMYVYAKPAQAFSINDTDQCVNGNNFVFTNSSTINPTVGLSYFWTFGNGDTSTQTSPTKTYSTSGTYPVKLRVTSINDCKDSVTKTVYIYPKPTPAFTINDTLQCFGPNVFTYTNGSTISSGTLSYFWRFNLLSANDTSTQTSPTKTYSGDGTFNVRLTATSDKQCKDSIQKQITIKPDIINNAISAPQNICQGNTPDTLRHNASALSGGNTTFTYQWQQSTDSVSWSNIGGATAANYPPPALFTTTWYRRIVFSGPCSDTSSPIKINVTPGIGNNTVTANQTQCAGFAPAKFTGTLPTGGSSAFAYQWQLSLDSASWSNITGAQDTNYQAGVLNTTTWYRRNVTSGSCTVISLPVKVTVNPKPAASFTTASVCFGFNANYTSTSTVSAGSISQFDWSFGDASTGTGSAPTHSYAAAGTYTTKLIITTAVGCKDSTTRTLRVHPKPVAAYIFNDTCFNDLTSFNGTGSTVASGSIISHNWAFGDGTLSSGSNTTKTYSAVGSYNAKLIVTTDSACKDSITKTVLVHPNPVTAYTVNDSDQCVNGNNFVFTNGSSISSGSVTYLWRRGENAADTVITTNASKIYAANGSYNVRLVSSSNFGCKDSITKTMVVYAKPAQAFSINDTDQCVNGNNFVFTNGSTINPTVGLSYFWTFGNGDTSTQTSPTKVYAASGTYPVKLRVTSINDCKDSVTKNVYVYPKPTPAFTINDTLQCFGPNVFTYTNGSTISSGTLSYFWRFNLLSANDTSTQISPTKTYATDGTFTIRLTATSDKLCKDSIQKQITVKPDIINNTISAPQNICEGSAPDTLRHNASALAGGNTTFTYQWQRSTDSVSWSNIGGATAANYAPPTLNVTTWYRRIVFSGPCSDTSNRIKILVTPAINNNIVSSNQTICAGFAPARFAGTLPTGGTGIYAYQWQNSTDSVSWADISGATNTNYQAPVLTQTTWYRRRIVSQACTVISPPIKVLVNPKPAASFNTASVCFGFDANYASTSTVSAGSIAQYDWSFGDATTGTGSTTTHQYGAAGTYITKLIITTAVGCKDSAFRTLRTHPKPVAAFVHNDTCQTFLTSFSAVGSTVATGAITAYNWAYGDGSFATGITTSKTYAAVGSYTAQLIVTTDSACKDSINKTVIIHPNPVTAFTINDSDQCVNGNNFVFTNGSSISSGSNTYKWNFGVSATDTSILTSPNKVYPANGNYTVKLIATSNFGCRDSINKPTIVYAKPAQAFSINDTDQCVNGNNFVFTNNSTINPAVGLSYFWTFGNGDTSTQTSPTKVYTLSGTYLVKLRVTSIHDCKDSITKTVYVYPKPSPAFTINDTLQCFGPNVFVLTNGSTISSGTLSYFWRFNVLSATDTSSQISPTKTYATDGVYTIRLTATSDKLCKDSIQKPITVKPDIVNNVVSPPQFICESFTPDSIKQTSGAVTGGSNTYSYQWQISTDSLNWSNVSGATGINYGPPALFVTTWYRRIITSGPCLDTSAPVKIHVTPAIQANVINSPQVICYAQTPAQLTSPSPGGGSGTYSYLWQQSADTVSWSSALSANTSMFYQPGSLTDTVYYRRRIISGSCTTISNVLKMAVKPLPVVKFSNSTVCYPNPTVFIDSSTVNQGSNVAWNWIFGDATTSTQQNPSKIYTAGTYTAKLIVTTNFGCKDSLSKSITTHPKPQAGFSSPNICFGFTSSFTDTAKVSTGSITNWNWDFGDVNTSTAKNPTNSYTSFGTFNVRQIVTTDRNCKDTLIKPLVIFPKPLAKFVITEECFPDSTSFTDSSSVATGSITNWAWTFGDGGNTGQTSPKHKYITSGTYISKLIVTTDNGCKDSLNKPATVRPLPAMAFNADTLDCTNRNVFFTNTSFGAYFYHWNYSDGDTSNNTVGQNVFNNPGYYRISLIGRTVYGCRDSAVRIIRIVAPPSPKFTILPDSGCAPLLTNFINTSTGDFTTYDWDFGNGASSKQFTPPSVTYQQSTVADTLYFVTLRATNLCATVAARDTVQVFPQPKANFGPDVNSGCTPKTFTITNTSTGFPDTYFWDFGDGTTSNAANPPPHLYTTDSVIKSYTIRLRVVNRCGTDTINRSVTVLPKNAKSLFGVDTLQGCSPLTVKLTDFSQGSTLVSYDFGDGNTSGNPNPTHTFINPGTYTIRQFITNTCTFDTSQKSITVIPGPSVSFTKAPSTQCQGQNVQFTSNSPGAAGFFWEFGNGDTSVLNNPVYRYKVAGTYTVKLTVSSGINSCKGVFTDTVNIIPLPTPVLSTDKTNGCPPLAIKFVDSTVGTAFITWKFGDGNTTSVINPTHTYTNTGLYVARMIVNNNNGCVDSIDRLITVHPEPTASFTHNSTYCDAPVTVNFTNISTGGTSYNWDFGNGVTSSVNNPTVSYNLIGTYTTTLSASNQFGCLDTATATFEVYRKPIVDFTLDSNKGCPPLTVNFADTSQFGITYLWDFGDGTTSTSRFPQHTFTKSGIYNVKLKVQSGGSCTDSLTLGTGVEVYPEPVAGFTYNFASQSITYGEVNFVDTSKNASTYLWDLGDGFTSTLQSPTHRYNNVGTYFITQYIATTKGCLDTAFVTLDLPFFGGVFVPNAFTPGAGGPDVRIFKPVAKSLKEYNFEVYDTWGKLLYSSSALRDTEPAEGWDGNHDGKPCQQDVYVWKVEAQFLNGDVWRGQKAANGKYYTEGTVTLIR